MVRIKRYGQSDYTRAVIETLQPFREALHAEKSPDEPGPTLESLERKLRGIPAHQRIETWIATLPDGTVVGTAVLVMFETEGQKHLADGRVEVHPSYRRKGLGRRLYSLMGAFARDHGRQTLVGTSRSRLPSGAAFMSAIHARPGLTEQVVRLELATLDREQLSRWAAPLEGFSAVQWASSCPDELLENYAQLTQLFNDIPVGEINLGDHTRTPELLREEEEARQRAGVERWTLAARDEATGNLVGLTELYFREDRPEKAHQGITGVEVAHRGHGLGRWLKASMLLKLLEEKPAVRYVETENALQNEAMRHINDALGFRLHEEQTVWQLELS
jgi:RimJ/RimL family protein N-acetyltransferase